MTCEATYIYRSSRGEPLYEVLRFPGKEFRIRRPDGRDGWIWNLEGVERVPYRLEEVALADQVALVEGEKDAESLRSLDIVASTNVNGVGGWRDEYARYFAGKHVIVIPDCDAPGQAWAERVLRDLHGVAVSLKLIELPGLEPGSGQDVTDWLEAGHGKKELLDLIETAPLWGVELAGDKVLREIEAFICRYVAMNDAQAVLCSLWVVHTHAFEAADATPYLAINSAEKESGKTRTLETFELLVARPWFTARVSAAVLARKTDEEQSTLLLDESDAAFAGEQLYSETLRGLLNSGYRRGGKVSCCVGQGANLKSRDFSTFAPKAIAGINRLPDTVASRSIPIRLKRALPSEKIDKFRRREAERLAEPLRDSIARWAASNLDRLRNSPPELPVGLSDRQEDVVEPLLAIADVAGGPWPERARAAAAEVLTSRAAADESLGVRLLEDIREVFATRGVDRMSSEELVASLVAIETSPWAGSDDRKPLTKWKLASLLDDFEIHPQTIRLGPQLTKKGYMAQDFEDAWNRYLPPVAASPGLENVTSSQAASDAGLLAISKGNSPSTQMLENSSKDAGCYAVTVSNQGEDSTGETWFCLSGCNPAHPTREAHIEAVLEAGRGAGFWDRQIGAVE